MNANDNNGKNRADSETRQESNLVNNNISFEKIREKTSAQYDRDKDKDRTDKIGGDVAERDDLIEKIEGLKTTETDMMFQYFADQQKMVPESEVKFFEKPKHDQDVYDKYYDKDKDRDKDKDKDKDKDRDKDYDHIHNEDNRDNKQNVPPQPSAHGPSYGQGQSFPDNGSKPREFATEEEEMLAKLDMLRKLGELTQYGVKLSQNYNMQSEYRAMKYEYELHKSIRDKRNGTKWLSNLMLNLCWGVEIANEKFNPFDFHLKGWSEQMSEDINDYDDVFGELYEKYFKAGKPIPPELKLMFMMAGSAVKFHIAHSAMSSLPNLGAMLSNNPQLADKLRQQAMADKLKKQSEKTKTAFASNSAKQHDQARQKASDIQMLRQKEAEYMRQQEEQYKEQYKQQQEQEEIMKFQQQDIFEKQKRIDNLQKQLNQQRSESRSFDGSKYTGQQQQGQKTMRAPIIPSSLKPKPVPVQSDAGRQASIMEQKKEMKYKESQKLKDKTDTPSYDGDRSAVNLNPNLDKIIKEKLDKSDTASKINEGSSIDASELSNVNGVGSTVVVGGKKRRVKKKTAIAINTN